MKSLLLMRHAKSSWATSELSDHDRPLNARGEHTAPRMGSFLRDQNLTPQIIFASSAVRAATTARLVAAASGHGGAITVLPSLYDADPNAYLLPLTALSKEIDRVLMVGHNPTLESLVFMLSEQVEEMPTAAIASIELDILQWQELTSNSKGQLLALWRPKEVLHDRTAE